MLLRGGAIAGYRLTALQREATNLADSVRQSDDRTHVKDSRILRCEGDGKAKAGIFSHTVEGACWPKTWSESVTAEGRNVVRHDDEWWMNNGNAWGRLYYVKDPNQYAATNSQAITPRMVLDGSSASMPNQDNPSTEAGDQEASTDASKFEAFWGSTPEVKEKPIEACPAPSLERPKKPKPKPDGDPPPPPGTGFRSTGDCCIEPHFKNKDGGCENCKPGQNARSHHGMIDFPLRTGSAGIPVHRPPGIVNYENALTICVPEGDHQGLHRDLNKIIKESGIDGVTTFGKVKSASFQAIDDLPDSMLSQTCKEEYKQRLKYDYPLSDDMPLRSNPNSLMIEGSPGSEVIAKAWRFSW